MPANSPSGATARELTTTQYAILGQLALREWSSYELARSSRRTLRWFWPRAESVVYAQAKRLADDGLVKARSVPAVDGSRRLRTMYSTTAAGRRELAAWMQRPPQVLELHHEALLRVHLARFATVDDLRQAVAWTGRVADDILTDARAVATEYVAGRHIFQGEAHIRGLLFDALTAQADALRTWSQAAQAELDRWADIEADDLARRRAVDRMRRFLSR